MILESGAGLLSLETGEADIRGAIAYDSRLGGFLVLSMTDRVFIKATGQGDGPYVLEYCAGNAQACYRAAVGVSKREVEEALLSYLTGGDQWLRRFHWERLRTKPWWKVW